MPKNIIIYTLLIFSFWGPVGTVSAQQGESQPVVEAALNEYEMPRSVSTDTATVIDELDVRNMDLKDVLKIISLKTGVQINYDEDLSGEVTVLLRDINIYDALRVILNGHALAYVQLKSPDVPGENVLQILTQERFESLYGYSFNDKRRTESVSVFYADPDAIVLELQQLKSPLGKTLYDEHTRTIILIDTPLKIEEMKAYVERMDIPSSAVSQTNEDIKDLDGEKENEEEDSDLFSFFRLSDKELAQRYQVDIHIIEITLNDEHQDGVDWEAIVADYQSLPFLGFRSTAKYDPEGELRIGVISDEDYVVLMDALDAVGVIETLEKNDFRGKLNKEYEIDIKPSDKLLVTDIREYRDMFKRDEMVRIHFTVDKDPEGLFSIEVEPEIRPNYYSRDIGELTTSLQNNYVAVIGGIFKDIKVEGTSKIPILGDLPFLGFAFRDNEERIRKAEYVVFLTLKKIEQ